jgi:hypothetical protein
MAAMAFTGTRRTAAVVAFCTILLCGPLLLAQTWSILCFSGWPQVASNACSDSDWVYWGGGVRTEIWGGLCQNSGQHVWTSCTLTAPYGCAAPSLFGSSGESPAFEYAGCEAHFTSPSTGSGFFEVTDYCVSGVVHTPWTGPPSC